MTLFPGFFSFTDFFRVSDTSNTGLRFLFYSLEIRRPFSNFSEKKNNSLGNEKFHSWLAGIIDGDGNFDLRKNSSTKKLVIKAIRIKLHNRDIRILTRIQNMLHCGRIRSDKKKTIFYVYCIHKRRYDTYYYSYKRIY